MLNEVFAKGGVIPVYGRWRRLRRDQLRQRPHTARVRHAQIVHTYESNARADSPTAQWPAAAVSVELSVNRSELQRTRTNDGGQYPQAGCIFDGGQMAMIIP